ncbi:MAG: TolC family protein [Planctomycetaceae bacterium]
MTQSLTYSRMTFGLTLCLGVVAFASGCAQTRSRVASESAPPQWRAGGRQPPDNLKSEISDFKSQISNPKSQMVRGLTPSGSPDHETRRAANAGLAIQLVSDDQPVSARVADFQVTLPVPEPDRPAADPEPLQLDDVIGSVIVSYPLLRSAMFGRNIAQGDLLAANGEFDLKLKADTLNMPLGFYENYRQSIGAEQPLFNGGSVFGGYRIGRGDFPVWYGERVTKEGGEFKAGATIPLAQNRNIDDRRAGLRRNAWEVQSVEPEIQAQLIEFIRAASITYWNWVAAGQNVRITEELLKNATDRSDNLRTRVKQGDAPPIELVDNERLIVSRRTKLIDARRKFQQSAYKLSLFLRDESGQPRVIDESLLPREFPQADDPSQRNLDADIQSAVASRPELRVLAILREQLSIDLANAQNLILPQVDAVLVGSQDVGNPADPKKDDKSPFELEGGLIASVPLQRRKARGKSQAVEGKLAQLQAKTQFTQEKIIAEVQSASAALNAAYQQLEQAHQSLDLARQMEAAERRKFDLGDSNLLLVNLREQATADAAATEVEARLNFFDAKADYRAALASDVVP